MAGPRERTPYSGIPVPNPDPNQLTLGELDVPMAVAPPLDTGPTEDTNGAVAIREPPVCGEWSFDPEESPEARAVVGMFASAAPVAGPPSTPSERPAARKAPGTSPNEGRTHALPALPPLPPAPPRPAPRSVTPPTPLPALDELKSIHDAHPADEQTALSLSAALAKRGNIEGALGVLERAIGAGADGVTLRCARASILSGRLRYDDAERELLRAQKLKPDDQTVLLQQGILACRRAKWREAVEPLARVVRQDSASSLAHFYLGEALSKLDRLGEALEAYHRAAELEPDNWRAFKGVGIVLDRMGRPSEAAEFYRRARDGQRGAR